MNQTELYRNFSSAAEFLVRNGSIHERIENIFNHWKEIGIEISPENLPEDLMSTFGEILSLKEELSQLSPGEAGEIGFKFLQIYAELYKRFMPG